MSKFEIGDWVVREGSYGYAEWNAEAMAKPRRVINISHYCISVNNFPYFVKHSSPSRDSNKSIAKHAGWAAEFFRLATPEEIAAITLQAGHIVVNSGSNYSYPIELHPKFDKTVKWRHVTSEEYRKFQDRQEELRKSQDKLEEEEEKDIDIKVMAGDLVVRENQLGWTGGSGVYRVISIDKDSASIRLNDNQKDVKTYWSASYFRHATGEEIALLPIKAGDWVTTIEETKETIYELFKGFVNGGQWRHATPEQFRKVLSTKLGIPENARNAPSRCSPITAKVEPKPCDVIEAIMEQPIEDTPVPIKSGDWVFPNPVYTSSQRVYRVVRLTANDQLVLGDQEIVFHKNNVRPATKAEIAAVPFKTSDLVIHPGGSSVVELVGVRWDKTIAWRHATPEEWRNKMTFGVSTIVSQKRVDEPLYDSRDELSQEIDAAKLEATLGDHENRLSELLTGYEATIQSLSSAAERLDDIEIALTEPRKKDPNDPLDCGECWSPRHCTKHNLPTIYRCRFTKKGHYVRVRGDYTDKVGRGEYANGGFLDDDKSTQGVMVLWPESLEPVPTEPKPDIEALQDKAWNNGKQIGLLDAEKGYHIGRKEGNMLATVMVILTILLMSGLSFLI